MKRFFSWLVVIVGLLIIAFIVRQCRTAGAANYQTAEVTRDPITQAVTATGTLNPVVTVQVGSQVSGNIAKLFADFNSQVKAGQVVAQIDPAIFQATVTQAEGDLASAKAALELARITAARTQELFARKTSSQADVDQAMATLHQAEANVKIKQGALDNAKADLDHCTITSPKRTSELSQSIRMSISRWTLSTRTSPKRTSELSQSIRMSISRWTLSRCKLFTGRSCRCAMRQSLCRML
ncbi:MAG: hypothetical protein DME72_03745 [Verrucomicrobia bacterium]|nr:MAG: hypothetical protein DME72_03745 [Verrucomicrobiota bacterium]